MSLTEPELAAAIAKVGRPRSHASQLIPVDVDKAKSLLEAGFSWNQVGEFFGCSGMTIRRRLGKTSVRTRRAAYPMSMESPALPGLPFWRATATKTPQG